MVQPLVSCIMPTKNRRQFVERSMRMFFNAASATPFSTELIILEDGDEDCRDVEVSEKVEIDVTDHKKPFTVQYLQYARIEGTIGAKLNYGASIARGKYVMRWDDDDFQYEERIARTLKHFELTGAKMVGMSSMLYYREGDESAWEYNAGDARYCTGSGQAYEREWLLANPHPDSNQGEDKHMAQVAAEQGVLSTISGTQWVIACTHDAHTGDRQHPAEGKWEKFFGRPADCWRGPIPFEKFAWIKPYLIEQPTKTA